MSKASIVAGALALAVALPLTAQTPADSTMQVKVGGFLDGYLAYDAGRPRTLDRTLSTTAARTSEVNVNLAFVDLTLTGPRTRGRLAIQFGTSLQANYGAEPRLGAFSGPDVARFIQEAYAGYQVTPSLWVDGGVFLAPFGAESWISRDNVTYTRSLIADNSPYYESGIRATWQATSSLSAQLHLINGWQNISETNSSKALGGRVDWVASPTLDLAYDIFVGNEQPDSVAARTRVFHEGIVKVKAMDALVFTGTYDIGFETRATPGTGAAWWRGWAVLAKYTISPMTAIGARVEGYRDPERVIVNAGPSPLKAIGGSLNLDLSPSKGLLWRNEVRLIQNDGVLFPDRGAAGGLSQRNLVAVTSLALSF